MRSLLAKPVEKKSKTAVPAPAPAKAPQVDQASGLPRFLGGRGDQDLAPRVQAKLLVNQPGDKYEQQADRIANIAAAGEHPTPVAEPPAAGARTSTPTSSPILVSGSGSPLNAGIRERAESALGTNLGHVRVHDSAADRALAQSLSAKAFTHGSHIWLGPQQSSGDVPLMAHETAHVVQQGAAPGDTHAVETAGAGGVAETGPVSATTAGATVQRLAEEVKKPKWGNTFLSDDSWMKFDPSAQLSPDEPKVTGQKTDFPGGRQQEFTLPEDTVSGKVALTVNASWFRNVWSGNQEGTGQATAEARYKITPDNKVEWSGGAQSNASSEGVGASISGTASAAGDTLAVTATCNGVGSIGDTSTTTVNVSPEGLGGSYAVGRTVTLPAGSSETKTYSIRLTRPPIPETSRTCAMYFGVNSDRLEEDSKKELAVWYVNLPDAMRMSIEAGGSEIQIIGHASTTNSVDYNLNLSDRRANRVAEILQLIAGTKAKIPRKARGYLEAKQFDKTTGAKVVEEDPSERMVEVIATFVDKPGGPKVP